MTVLPGYLSGDIQMQPSKSIGHRALICAALAQGESRIRNLGHSEDIEATYSALESLGLIRSRSESDGVETLQGNGNTTADPLLNCGESGSTLRFLIPLALNGGEAVFTGRGRLMRRPQQPYQELLTEKGIRWEQTEDKLTVQGVLPSGRYSLRGDVSSQFITGLLFALPRLKGDSCIELTTPLQSRGYVDLTLEMLANFGICAAFIGPDWLVVPGNQTYRAADIKVEGDYSHAAFYLTAGALGGNIRIHGLKADSLQGDKAAVNILQSMGADIRWENGVLHAQGGSLHGVEIDASQIPDLVPPLAVAACGAQGETRIMGAERLKFKESDRLEAMTAQLRALGAAIEKTDDGLRIIGGTPLKGGMCSSCADHRVAMSLAVASALCTGPVELDDGDCVAKSAPDFWAEFASMGGQTK